MNLLRQEARDWERSGTLALELAEDDTQSLPLRPPAPTLAVSVASA
jgi:hypothetical protein